MGSKLMIKWPKKITSALVEQLIKAERDPQKALLVFDAATAEYVNGFQHDRKTYGLMIRKLLSANEFGSAENLLNRMKDDKCEIPEEIFLSICRAYGRVHKPRQVIQTFQKMKDYGCKPTEKSYISVFAILVEETQLKLALNFYKYMREMKIPPSVTSLNVLIKALCKNSGTLDSALRIFQEMPNHGCTPDSYTYGTLINGLCRFGKIDEAKELFGEMNVKKCSPSVVTYSSLINGLCKGDKVDEALGLLEEMISKNIEPNVYTYSSMMDGFCKNGRSSQAIELLEIMVQRRYQPNMITYTTLINGLCKEEKLLEALEILDRMKLQGKKPDAGIYGKMINVFCDADKFQEATNFLDEMVLGRISPNRITWNLHVKVHNRVVRGLCCENDLNRGFQLYLSTRGRGITIEDETFEILVNRFCKKGNLDKSARVLGEMVIDGCVPNLSIWSDIVSQFWGRRKVLESAESVLFELLVEKTA